MELSQLIANYVMQFVSATPVVVFVATGLSMFLPNELNTKKDNMGVKAANILLSSINVIAGNILKNKNK